MYIQKKKEYFIVLINKIFIVSTTKLAVFKKLLFREQYFRKVLRTHALSLLFLINFLIQLLFYRKIGQTFFVNLPFNSQEVQIIKVIALLQKLIILNLLILYLFFLIIKQYCLNCGHLFQISYMKILQVIYKITYSTLQIKILFFIITILQVFQILFWLITNIKLNNSLSQKTLKFAQDSLFKFIKQILRLYWPLLLYHNSLFMIFQETKLQSKHQVLQTVDFYLTFSKPFFVQRLKTFQKYLI
ncbi:transmembrane protein, putative (macronuclear) [Tetrahymena thermophila SB210]|uniref:Transmembrane protein, putative n=1 Tax=Tetrahymena thermophila (strain SB210) TaxID=312017 RepID=W7XCP6_TETTS|nr:transmembrane protein, putative [Tetrahymena thermophila SB210]EWS71561.1 transmembrane protein, putative [Tetrahymena thermophila SB210]|eukprot:XP_012655906.1 transmembrane protein, putative [Tetrahymena thermophila SB210]